MEYMYYNIFISKRRGGINMEKVTESREKTTKKKCGMVTCIHCICNKCTVDKCDFYERIFRQEY